MIGTSTTLATARCQKTRVQFPKRDLAVGRVPGDPVRGAFVYAVCGWITALRGSAPKGSKLTVSEVVVARGSS
jgi:hypothetical protein